MARLLRPLLQRRAQVGDTGSNPVGTTIKAAGQATTLRSPGAAQPRSSRICPAAGGFTSRKGRTIADLDDWRATSRPSRR